MTNNRVERTDPAFYVACDGPEWVFQEWDEWEARYSVVRAGEMSLRVRHNKGDEWTNILSTTDLFDFGIHNDADLASWESCGDDLFQWVNNPWFEVVDEEQEAQSWGEIAANVFDNLADAEQACMAMNEQYRKENA